MISKKLKAAARKNIKKAQKAWQSMSRRARLSRQPAARRRRKAVAGIGNYYKIEVRDKDRFVTLRTQDVGRKGDIKRLAGKRSSGRWDTQAWLIPKSAAHIKEGHLVPVTDASRQIFKKQLGSEPIRVRADRFKAKPRGVVSKRKKPTPAQIRARRQNILKAQKARREMVAAGR